MGKDGQIVSRAGGRAHVRYLACYVGGVLKTKDLLWLPSLDTFRTFAA